MPYHMRVHDLLEQDVEEAVGVSYCLQEQEYSSGKHSILLTCSPLGNLEKRSQIDLKN